MLKPAKLRPSGETVTIGSDYRDVPAAYVTEDGYRVERRVAYSMPGAMVYGQWTTGCGRTTGWSVVAPGGGRVPNPDNTLAGARLAIARERICRQDWRAQ